MFFVYYKTRQEIRIKMCPIFLHFILYL
uniref:Uncharacterized protein n=1 Tax=Ciona intestinalis TaxID=7719 RepID=H2XSB1_CIOIN